MLAHWAPGVLTGFGRALREPCGRVQWAGTETAIEWHGAIEGAVRISFFFVFVSCCFWHHCQRKPFRFGRIINVSIFDAQRFLATRCVLRRRSLMLWNGWNFIARPPTKTPRSAHFSF